MIGQEDVENHIGQHGIKTPPSLIPSTKQLGSHRLIGQDDVVVWFANVCFGIEVEDIPLPCHYRETLRELGPCCDHKHPLQELSSNYIALRDGCKKLMEPVVGGNTQVCHGKD